MSDYTYEQWEKARNEAGLALRAAVVAEATAELEAETSKGVLDQALDELRQARMNRNRAGKLHRSNMITLGKARKELSAAEKRYRVILELEPEQPEEPEGPTFDDPDDQALYDYIRSLPEFISGEMPDFPWYQVPVEADCDWIITPGHACSGELGITLEGDYPMGAAYQAWRQAGKEGRCTFGVRGNIGMQQIGHGWGTPSASTVHWRLPDGSYEDLDIEIVGLDTTAEVELGLGNKYGFVDRIAVFNCGLRGGSANFIVKTIDSNATADVGDVVFDGIWYLNRDDWSEGDYVNHTSAFHLGDHRSLVLRRMRLASDVTGESHFRGREHTHYDKSSWVGDTWIVQNNMKGGNRTFFQRRPGAAEGNERPAGAYVVALNEGPSYGWDHEYADGGSAITIWTAPDDDVFVVGNRVEDARYGCVMFGGQPEHQGNWYCKDEDGNDLPYVIQRAFVWDNQWDNPRGNRTTAQYTAVKELHLGACTYNSPPDQYALVLNGKTQSRYHNMVNGEVWLHDDEHVQMDIWTYEPAADRYRALSMEEKEAMRWSGSSS